MRYLKVHHGMRAPVFADPAIGVESADPGGCPLRTANYLSVSQIYFYGNPLLKWSLT
jgi:hypothetical protein